MLSRPPKNQTPPDIELADLPIPSEEELAAAELAEAIEGDERPASSPPAPIILPPRT